MALVVAALLLSAGCDPAKEPRQPPVAGQAAKVSRESKESKESNRRAAEREASRLLSLVQLPPGASPLTGAPAALSGAGLGTPMVSTLVDRERFWTVPMSFADLTAWVRAHPPQGNPAATGSASGSGPQGRTAGFGYAGGTSSAWASAQLELGLAPAAERGHSYLRADAVVVWLDPQPLRDTSPGPRLHFTVADGCPAKDNGTPQVSNPGAHLDREILPDERPARAIACEYGGLNAHRFTLIRQTTLDAEQAWNAATLLRSLRLAHTDGGVRSCPMDDLSMGYLALGYADGTTVDVRVDLGGCAYASNGQIRVEAGRARGLFPGSP